MAGSESRPLPRPRGADLRLLPAAGMVWAAAAAVEAGAPVPPRPAALAPVAVAALLHLVLRPLLLRVVRPSWARIAEGVAASATLCLIALAAFVACIGPADEGAGRRLGDAADSERTVRLLVESQGEARVVQGRFGSSQVLDAVVREADGVRLDSGPAERITLWRALPEGARTERPCGAEEQTCELTVLGRLMRDGGRYAMQVGAMTPSPPRSPDGPEEALVPAWLGDVVDRLRTGQERRAEAQLAQDAAALVLGMTYGDDSGLRPETEEALKTAGLTHLTAVSGANVALVFLLGVHAVRWTRCPRPTTIGVGLAAVGGYVVLVGPEPSVLRAAVMGLLGGVTLALGRGGAAVATLWIAIIVLLCADRHLVGEPGFILSVLATAGIVLQGPMLCRVLVGWMPRFIADPLSVTAVAGLWCGPYLVWMTEYWAPFTLPANLLVAPVVPGVTLTGLLALCLQGSAPVGASLTIAAGWGARWVELVGVGAGSLPLSRVEAGASPGPVVFAAVLALVVTVLAYRADPLRGRRGGALPDNLSLSLDRPP
ncbi:ComEC/Rec2 family competence protein [Rothia sp. AR01]|uniref:ComEC/Rec2 family competence protein n=1 Tax=Rothia santali TaxID=2949643 RepID=A0A9X2HGE5_9MICC|nr:ComEC/Rec2 family competence protein [Rothia santali]MCP3427227.1 ComEC/Rec2 family competence protein [Rothia santali]